MKRSTIIAIAVTVIVMLLLVQMASVDDAGAVRRGKPPTRTPSPGAAMHVQNIEMSWDVKQGNKYYGVAVVTIVDEGGSPAGEATVSGQWSGAASDADTATTGSNGQTDGIQSDAIRGGGDFGFCVTGVAKAGVNYDAAANVETCDSISAPPGDPTPTPTPEPGGSAKWTFMVYIVGDNNLEEYVAQDIEQELGYSNADVSVVVLADRHPEYDSSAGDWTGTKLFYVTPGMTADPENALEDWGEKNTGDPQVLIDFIQWTQANYPADHYALSFWDHGWSWRPYQSMWDETDDDTLDQHEIQAVLDVVGPIDVIMYDACQMATIENAATLRNYSQAVVHSQEYVGGDGIEYELVLPALQANPDMTAAQLAIEINQSAATNREKTGSAVALDANFDALITAVDEWAIALQNGLAAYRSNYVTAFRATRSFNGDATAKDLYDAAYEISNRVADPDIQAKSQAVMNAVDAAVLDEWHVKAYANAHGISIFVPSSVDDLDEPSSPQWNDFDYYRNYLTFSQLTHWDEFLDAYINGQ